MKRLSSLGLALLLWYLAWGGFSLAEKSVRDLVLVGEFPVKIKTRSKVARWDQIDQTLNQKIFPHVSNLPERVKAEVGAALGDMFSEKVELKKRLSENGIRFADIFLIGDGDVFFPLTNSVVKLAPDSSLAGLTVYDKSRKTLGTFSGKSRYERAGGLYSAKSYTLITFQYQTAAGEYRSAGNDNLLDNFLVRWSDIKDRPALDFSYLITP